MGVILERLVTAPKFTRILLWSMNCKLVIVYGKSSCSSKVTVLLTTLETAVFVICPNMSRQRIERLERIGTGTTIPLGQAAMLIAVMDLQLMPKQNK